MKAIGLTSTYTAPHLAEADAVVNSLSQIEVRNSALAGTALLIKVN
jgi:hypothetical protein